MQTPLPSLILLIACAPQAELACAELCYVAEPLQEQCLLDEGLTWAQSRWGSAEDFAASCQTWIWTQRRLARSAHSPLRREGDRTLAQACTSQVEQLTAEPTCTSYRSIDWNEPLWEAH